MKHKLKPESQDKVRLKIVLSTQIVCSKCGSKNYVKGGFRKSGKQRYRCKNCGYQFVAGSQYNPLVKSNDVWTANDLGLKISSYKNDGDKLNFELHIQQAWLKEYLKRFIRYKANQSNSFRALQRLLNELRPFCKFLKESPIQNIEDINRQTILDYLRYLGQQPLAQSTKSKCISAIALFFEVGVANGWFNVEPYLIRRDDYPKKEKALPRYIPEEVVRQLNQHLDALPEPIIRMVLVIQECGLRIGELCQLPLNCLKQDTKGGWFIQFMRWKMNFETTLPVSIELAQVIQEQQAYIQKHFAQEYKYLFCARKQGQPKEFIPQAKVITDTSFIDYLKRLADKFNICDSTGKSWNFQTHQFRHAVGTRMINNGVPQHIVQRYLGHESPQMTAVYAHIHDATLKKEIDKYLDSKVININGEVIESLHPELDNDSNLQWMKKKVLAEILPNGSCGLPAHLTCGKGNACLTCGDFRTTIEFLDQHKEHLERTKKVLEVAEANGWQRQIQVNQDVKKSLEKIISSLEEKQDE